MTRYIAVCAHLLVVVTLGELLVAPAVSAQTTASGESATSSRPASGVAAPSSASRKLARGTRPAADAPIRPRRVAYDFLDPESKRAARGHDRGVPPEGASVSWSTERRRAALKEDPGLRR